MQIPKCNELYQSLQGFKDSIIPLLRNMHQHIYLQNYTLFLYVTNK